MASESCDSPSLVRICEDALVRASSTCALSAEVTCSAAMVSPVLQFTAFKPTAYWSADAGDRSIDHCCGSGRVRRPGARRRGSIARQARGPSVSACRPILSSETIFRYGDCSSCAARPCRRVPSKTVSPVVLVKSASTIVSFSVSGFDPGASGSTAQRRSAPTTTTAPRAESSRDSPSQPPEYPPLA